MCNNKNKHSGGVSCSAYNAFIFLIHPPGWPLVSEKSGKFYFSSRSGKSQGILQIGQGNFKYQESQGKVREVHNFGQNMCCNRYFDYLKSVDFFLSLALLAWIYENLLILEHSVPRNYLRILFVSFVELVGCILVNYM